MKKLIFLVFICYGSILAKENIAMCTHLIKEPQSITGVVETSVAKIWYKKFYTAASEYKIPIICLHGGPGLSHHSMLSLKNLASFNPVIFYDQSGCGNSKTKDPQFHNWTFDHYLQELHEFIDALGYKKIFILGWSSGGTLAIKYANEHQEKLAGLVLASPAINFIQWQNDSRKLAASLPDNIGKIILGHEAANTTNEEEYKNSVATLYNNFLCRLEPWPSDLLDSLKVWNYDIYKTMWGSYELTISGNLKDVDLTSILPKIIIPTLITCGRFDLATPETMQYYVQQLPHAKLVIFEKSSHVAFAEEPEKYMQVVQEFLKLHNTAPLDER